LPLTGNNRRYNIHHDIRGFKVTYNLRIVAPGSGPVCAQFDFVKYDSMECLREFYALAVESSVVIDSRKLVDCDNICHASRNNANTQLEQVFQCTNLSKEIDEHPTEVEGCYFST